ncbi:MAG: hypothetical protein EOO56_07985 [Hymenobacter sp.]|nr:MAG: hypothetical protein EOO56_07985 [Hymenobacter sp.]
MGLFSNLSFRKRSPAEAAPAPATAEPAAQPASHQAAAAEPVPAPPLALAQEAAAPEPAISAEMRAQAEAMVRHVAEELPDFMTVAIVDSASGGILAGQWAGHSGGAVEMALANAEIVRQTRLCIEALQLAGTEQLTDILITLRHELHLLRALPQAEWLLYLAVRTQDTNAALVRAAAQLIDN